MMRVMERKGAGKQFLLALIVIGMVWGGDRLGWWAPVKGEIERGVAPVRGGLWWVAQRVIGVREEIRFVRTGVERIADLERENAQLRVETFEVGELRQENEELRKLLKLSGSRGLKLVNSGRVLGRLGEELIVDKGKQNGIKEKMSVVTREMVVVGKVVAVGEFTSKVRLVTHFESEVAVGVGAGLSSGRLRGRGGERMLLDEVVAGEVIREGDTVVTSGQDEVYPAGLVVGKVVRILSSGAEVYQQAEVVPVVVFVDVKRVIFLEGN
ncbi:MAG: rod shape-determining protein MreC [Candidatus Chisholmbacteria bacterium]|nr:rod shape-determining protein MreC [Candidatus Chisholmbacteria bacterium]